MKYQICLFCGKIAVTKLEYLIYHSTGEPKLIDDLLQEMHLKVSKKVITEKEFTEFYTAIKSLCKKKYCFKYKDVITGEEKLARKG